MLPESSPATQIIFMHVYLRLASYSLFSEIEKNLDLAVIFSHGSSENEE